MDQQKVDEVKKDFDLIYQTLENKDLLAMFRSPVITSDKKQKVVDAIYQGKIDDLSLKYLHLLIGKKRESYLKEIAEEYQMMCLKHKHITDLKVISAVALTDDVIADLKARMTKSQLTDESVQITNVVDPSIIGGFILEFDDKRYDSSILSKLDALKGEFTKNLYIREF